MNSLGLFLYNVLVLFIPETRGFGLKRFMLRLCGADIDKGVRICSSVKILGSGKLHIGANTWVGHQTLIISSSNVHIGSEVDIAPRVYIGTGTHKLEIGSNKAAGEGLSEDIIINNGCWICANSTILPGVTIGMAAVVGAGALVNNNISDKSVVAGIPAKVIKKYS